MSLFPCVPSPGSPIPPPRPRRASAWLGLTVLLLAAGAPAGAGESSSTSYVLSQSTVNSAGGTAVSSSFVLDGTAAQTGTVGEAGSTSFVLQSGFWTNLSTRLVVTVAGTGSGRGTVTGPGIHCTLDGGVATGDCTETVTHGTSLGLVASPDPANQFDAWSGCNGTSTSTIPGDTCQVTLFGDRILTASFTLLGTAGDFVWRDVDGDGLQDPGEPGLDGVEVTIDDGAGLSAPVVTGSGGAYLFLDVPPAGYTMSVDPGTLPPGLVPSHDLDGVGTPHRAAFTLTDGEDQLDVDFGYRPFVDLAITKDDSQDPLPGGETLIYTLTVTNAGPSYATNVVVTDVLPSATNLVESIGCAEDPAGAPTCTLGTLAAGAGAGFTLEVSIDPAPPGSITNTATVASAEADLDGTDNSAGQSTQLDDAPPSVVTVEAQPATADGLLTECESVHDAEITALRVEFDEFMLDPAGDATPGDVTRTAGWSLVRAGDDAEFSTTACGVPAGDDVAVAIAGVAYDVGTSAATVTPAGGALDPGLYRLFACGTGPDALVDRAGNPLDGDGDGNAGGDFVRGFRADPENLFDNGHFDCDLGAWDASSDQPSQIAWAVDDVDGSADSGSGAVTAGAGSTDYALDQCVPATSEEDYRLDAGVRLATESLVSAQLVCSFYGSSDCGGTPAGTNQSDILLLGDSDGVWLELDGRFTAPTGSSSARCGVRFTSPTRDDFEAHVDPLELRRGARLFEDGFESGDTTNWSASVP